MSALSAETAATENPLLSASRPPKMPKKLPAGGGTSTALSPLGYVAISRWSPM